MASELIKKLDQELAKRLAQTPGVTNRERLVMENLKKKEFCVNNSRKKEEHL